MIKQIKTKIKELLAILLRTGTKEKSVLDVAQQIFSRFPKKKLKVLNQQYQIYPLKLF